MESVLSDNLRFAQINTSILSSQAQHDVQNDEVIGIDLGKIFSFLSVVG
jgi:hypothetical protein